MGKVHKSGWGADKLDETSPYLRRGNSFYKIFICLNDEALYYICKASGCEKFYTELHRVFLIWIVLSELHRGVALVGVASCGLNCVKR